MTSNETRFSEVLNWLGVMLVAAITVGLAVVFIHAARADSAHWKVVVDITSPEGDKAHLVYGSQATGAVYFDSEAACKTELSDPKSVFRTAVWPAITKSAKQAKITLGVPYCVLDVPVTPKNEI